ncbi:hypothetical protein SAMN04487831_10774 [Pseudobutyrivibrio sp. UC1225]|uniref:hypothetical protein n=1 Tax=Pseudobutyrivibrio sp. UC1225 TaxID=1798185 RepID=UPI0008E2E225|nr:hypothetical protein [Pseudobutyrivibrio sp. UC1225]SFO06902.1 hypothetical protein SAMN04487831_10774 [Pseudobutyrivibrio sp. UC1225]
MEEKVNLLTECGVRIKNKIYFCSTYYNVVFSLDMEQKDIILESIIPMEDALSDRLSTMQLLIEDKLLFVPMNAKKVWVWEIGTNHWHGIDLPDLEGVNNKFFQAVVMKNIVFMFGCQLPIILRLNLSDESIKIIKIPFNIHLYKQQQKKYLRRDYVIIDNYIYMASCFDNCVMRFDYDDESVELLKVGKDNYRYAGIAFDGNNFWLTLEYEARVIRCDKELNIIEEVILDEENDEIIAINGIEILSDNTIFVESRFGMSYLIHYEKNMLVDKVDKTFMYMSKENEYEYFFEKNGVFTVKKGNKKEIFDVSVKRRVLYKFLKKSFTQKFNQKENSMFRLDDYLTVLDLMEDRVGKA